MRLQVNQKVENIGEIMIEFNIIEDGGRKHTLEIVYNGKVYFSRREYGRSQTTGQPIYKFNGRFWNLNQLKQKFSKFKGETEEEFMLFASKLTKQGRTYHDRK